MKRAQLARSGRTLVGRHCRLIGLPEPPPECVARQAGLLGNGMQRHLVAQMHSPDFSQNFHGDHLFCSRLKIRQSQ